MKKKTKCFKKGIGAREGRDPGFRHRSLPFQGESPVYPHPNETRSNEQKTVHRDGPKSQSVMILPQVHLRKPCYDFYFL